MSVSKDTPSSTVPLTPLKRPKEVTRAVHCWSFAYIYIHCLFPMTPNQESSGSMPTSSEPVRVPVRLPLPVANLEVSDSILNIYIIYIRFHSKCSVLRFFYHHSRLKMLDWYKYIYIYIFGKNMSRNLVVFSD